MSPPKHDTMSSYTSSPRQNVEDDPYEIESSDPDDDRDEGSDEGICSGACPQYVNVGNNNDMLYAVTFVLSLTSDLYYISMTLCQHKCMFFIMPN